MTLCPTPTLIRPDGPPQKSVQRSRLSAETRAGEHRMIVGQDGIVPVLKKICQVDFDPFAENTAAINGPSPSPIDPCRGRDPRSPEDRTNPEITTTTEPALGIGPLEQIFSQRLIRK